MAVYRVSVSVMLKRMLLQQQVGLGQCRRLESSLSRSFCWNYFEMMCVFCSSRCRMFYAVLLFFSIFSCLKGNLLGYFDIGELCVIIFVHYQSLTVPPFCSPSYANWSKITRRIATSRKTFWLNALDSLNEQPWTCRTLAEEVKDVETWNWFLWTKCYPQKLLVGLDIFAGDFLSSSFSKLFLSGSAELNCLWPILKQNMRQLATCTST